MPHIYLAKSRGTCGNSLTVTHTLHWLSKGPQYLGSLSRSQSARGKGLDGGHVGTLGIPHTNGTRLKQGLVCTGTTPSPAGTHGGGTGLAFLSQTQRCSGMPNPPLPPLRWGSPSAEPMIRWGPRDRFLWACGQTPDGGYSVREPAVRAWGDRLGLATRSASQARA